MTATDRPKPICLVLLCVLLARCAASAPGTETAVGPVASAHGTVPPASPSPTSSPASTVPSSTPARSPSGTSNVFASNLYGYSLSLPPGWTATATIFRWTTGFLEGRCPGNWDCVRETQTTRSLGIAALRLPKGDTLTDWQRRIRAAAPDICLDAETTSQRQLGGELALKWTSECQEESLQNIKAVTIHGRNGYVMIFASPASLGWDADQAAFDHLVSTFAFGS